VNKYLHTVASGWILLTLTSACLRIIMFSYVALFGISIQKFITNLYSVSLEAWDSGLSVPTDRQGASLVRKSLYLQLRPRQPSRLEGWRSSTVISWVKN